MSENQPVQEAGGKSETKAGTPLPVWFWLVGGIALLWNLLGVAAFVAESMMTEDAIAALPEELQVEYRNIPGWYYAVFAVATLGGLAGSIALLLRSKWATWLLAASLLAVITQQIYLYALSNIMTVMGPASMGFQATILIIGIGLLVFAIVSSRRGWLR